MANQNRTGQRAGAGQRGQARTRSAAARRSTGGRAAAGRATGSRAAAGRAQAAQRETATTRRETATTRAGAVTEQAQAATERHGRTLTVTIPERAADIAMLPVAAGRRVLTAKTGLPVYVGLGVLAAVDVIELPVAAAVGAGYAALRRWGPLRPVRGEPDGRRARSS